MKYREECEAQECMNGPWLPAKFVRYSEQGVSMVLMNGNFWEKPVHGVRPISAIDKLAKLVKP